MVAKGVNESDGTDKIKNVPTLLEPWSRKILEGTLPRVITSIWQVLVHATTHQKYVTQELGNF